MRRRWTALAGVWALALAAPGIAAPQPAQPSLDGLWTNATSTPLERHWAFGSLVATARQAAAWREAVLDAWRGDGDEVGGRQTEWFDVGAPVLRVGGQYRTSLIVEPANGRLPYTPEGRELALAGVYDGGAHRDDPEARPPSERCLAGASGAGGAPLLPANDNANYRIVQTPDAVVISAENGGALRIIRMNADRHLPPQMAPWGGDSIGHWEGPTLVAETTNFRPGEAVRGPRPLYISPAAKVTERFTRTAEGEIAYRFTVEDPAIYTQAWSGELIFRASGGREFEYACHEGNYSLANVLAGARHEEAEAWRPNSTPRAAGDD